MQGLPSILAAIFFAACALAGGAARAESLYSGMEEVAAQAREVTAETLPALRAAAQRGEPLAQLQLGFIYAEGGAGLPVDDAAAAKLFESAAGAGQVYAQVMIATLYTDGRGVPASAEKAMLWFGKAAEQGNPEALYALGALRGGGAPGVNVDPVEAWKWLSLALRATSNDGKKRTFEAALATLKKDMTQEQLEVGRERVQRWLIEHPGLGPR